MVNSDPKRTPSFTMFGDDDFFFQIGNVCKGPSPDPGVPSASTRASPGTTATRRTRSATPGSAWSGRASTGTASTARRGPITSTCGRRSTRCSACRTTTSTTVASSRRSSTTRRSRRGSTPARRPRISGDAYKQINAPFGQFATDTLVASTAALKTSDALKYDSIEASIANLTSTRNALAGADPAGAERRGVRQREARRESGEGLDQAGPEPARPGSRARGGESRVVARRSRSTSEGSSSRHRPGSSPSSVSGP